VAVQEPTRVIITSLSAMAIRGLSVITHKVAASLPNRSGAKVRLSSGERRLKPLSITCLKNCVERA